MRDSGWLLLALRETVTAIAEIVHRREAFALLTVIVSLLASSPLAMGHFDLEFPERAEAC